MPRDLFAGTFERTAGPRRSKWTIAGSFIAHTVLLLAVLVLPVLSAFDSYVVQARNIAFLVPPAPVMPAVPAAPPKTAPKIPSDIKPDAAPLNQAEKPVTGDAIPVTGPPGPPGSLPIGEGIAAITRSGATLVNIPPQPPPVVVAPIRPGGKVSAPTRTSYADPIYPQIAVAAKIEGMVILEATIDQAGVVRDVRVLRSIPMLDQAAMDAVKRWRYTPTRLNGVAVPILLTVTVTFSLR